MAIKIVGDHRPCKCFRCKKRTLKMTDMGNGTIHVSCDNCEDEYILQRQGTDDKSRTHIDMIDIEQE